MHILLTDPLHHAIGVGFFLLLLLAPLPLAAAAAREGDAVRRLALQTLLIWCATHTVLGTALGLSGQLRPLAVAIVNAILMCTGCAVLLRHPGRALLFRKVVRGWQTESAVVLTAASAFAVAAVGATTTPVTDHDSLAYHLPVMAHWYQSHSLATPEHFGQIRHYPFGWELLSTLFLMPFKEDTPVAVPQLIAWLMLAVGCYALSMKAGAGRHAALVGAWLAMTPPVVLTQLNAVQVDLALAAMFVAALYFGVEYVGRRAARDAALCGLALGLLIGVKTSGLVYAAIAVGSLIAVWRAVGRRRRGVDATAPSAVAVLVCGGAALVVGGFWYARNIAEVGNPLGSVAVAVGPVQLLPGTISRDDLWRTTLAALFDIRDVQQWRVIAGAAMQQLYLPAVLATVLGALACMGRGALHDRGFIGLAALCSAALLAYVTTPYSGDNGANGWRITPWIGQGLRYAIPAMSLFVVSAVVGGRVELQRRDATVLALVCGGLAFATHASDGLRVMYIVGVTGLLGWTGGRLFHRVRPSAAVRVVLVVALVAAVFVATAWLRARRDAARAYAYGGVLQFIDNETTTNDVIAYLISDQNHYLFFGTRLDRKVIYVPTSDQDQVQWARSLRAAGVTVVAISPLGLPSRGSKEAGWLEDPNGPFVRVFGQVHGATPALYRFRGDR